MATNTSKTQWLKRTTKVLRKTILEAAAIVQPNMSDEERLELWRDLRKGYCPDCGTKHLPCHCQNDS